MSIKLKINALKAKVDGTFQDSGIIFGDTADNIESINAAGVAQVENIENKGREVLNNIPDLSESVEALQGEVNEQKQEIAELSEKKVGYSEVVDGQLLMYADESKAILLATLDLPQSDGKVKDVQVAGTGESIIGEDGIAKIPIGSPVVAGVVKPAGATYGIAYQTNGNISTASATEADIDARSNDYKPITPKKLERAVTSVVDFKKGDPVTKQVLEPSDLVLYVKNTDVMGSGKMGIAAVESTSAMTGIRISEYNGVPTLMINSASESRINSRSGIQAITPSNLEYAVKSVTNSGEHYEELTMEEDAIFTFAPKTANGENIYMSELAILVETNANVALPNRTIQGNVRTLLGSDVYAPFGWLADIAASASWKRAKFVYRKGIGWYSPFTSGDNSAMSTRLYMDKAVESNAIYKFDFGWLPAGTKARIYWKEA